MESVDVPVFGRIWGRSGMLSCYGISYYLGFFLFPVFYNLFYSGSPEGGGFFIWKMNTLFYAAVCLVYGFFFLV